MIDNLCQLRDKVDIMRRMKFHCALKLFDEWIKGNYLKYLFN